MSDDSTTASGAHLIATQNQPDSSANHNSDDEPMVHTTPRDYATWARLERERLIAEGTDPKNVMLQSEVFTRQQGETPEEMAQRISSTMEDARGRGVVILNDMCVADVKPDTFQVGGRRFDLGPKSGVTRGEYRDFGEWFNRAAGKSNKLLEQVPEKFRKFEKPVEDSDPSRFSRR
jgi:hypothetical protein